jgi:hypothetical protein
MEANFELARFGMKITGSLLPFVQPFYSSSHFWLEPKREVPVKAPKPAFEA